MYFLITWFGLLGAPVSTTKQPPYPYRPVNPCSNPVKCPSSYRPMPEALRLGRGPYK